MLEPNASDAFLSNRERLMATAVAAAALMLFAAMPVWRDMAYKAAGRSLTAEYQVAPEVFADKLDAQLKAYATGAEDDGAPVVRPPPGDVFLIAQRFHFQPVLELEAGKSYRLHVTSGDVVHGFHLDPGIAGKGVERLLLPGRAQLVSVTPAVPGRYAIVCADYCGIGHNKMNGWIHVVEEARR